MTKLDLKLTKIIIKHEETNHEFTEYGVGRDPMPDTVAQIKQAFSDEGWLKPNTDRHRLVEAMNKAISEQPLDEMLFMTGQMFYDRFMKEIELLTKHLSKIQRDVSKWSGNKAMFAAIVADELNRAARRAAGLKDE